MICLLCLSLLVIWTSPKSNVSMVNWLVYCRFDLDYRIAWWFRIRFSKNQKTATSMACACRLLLFLPACINSLHCTL